MCTVLMKPRIMDAIILERQWGEREKKCEDDPNKFISMVMSGVLPLLL